MGVSRLLAKAWIVTCLFAGAHALRFALLTGGDLWAAASPVLVAMALFAAMGLLFVGGYGASASHSGASLIERSLTGTA